MNETTKKTPSTELNIPSLKERITDEILELASGILKLDAHDIATDEELGDSGFDSISMTKFSNAFNEYYNLKLLPTTLSNYPTIDRLADFLSVTYPEELASHHMKAIPSKQVVSERDHTRETLPVKRKRTHVLQEEFPEEHSIQQHRSAASQPIAIIGMSGRFPGASNLEEFWKNLVEGKDCISEVPEDRWDWRKYYDDSQAGKRRMTPKWGGFIEDIDRFDAAFFHISPKEAELMDPRQRLFLETVWKTIEDAGYKASDLSGTDTGLYVGVCTNDYYDILWKAERFDPHTPTGNEHSILANRVSYVLNLHGPSEAVDTACSSSFMALYNAVNAIRAGDCSAAIVGGVHAILVPNYFVSFGKAGMLSWDGRCKTFDERANGYVRGEGVGAVLLKPLDKAEKDGDHIYGVIKATAVNHGGKANSLTAPRVEAQKELLVKAYSRSGLDIESIGYIEAHGTGTKLGDPREVEALKQAFEALKPKTKATRKKAYCGLGTAKSSIGHLEGAAGIAGLIKVLLSIKHKKLTKVVHFENLNPRIDLEDSPFYIIDKTQEWKPLKDRRGKPYPRRAGVSSFGFGGANAHVVIEEYVDQFRMKNEEFRIKQGPVIIVLSAKNRERLKAVVKNLLDYFTNSTIHHSEFSIHNLQDVAYTLQAGREAMEERLAFITNDIGHAIQQLDNYLRGNIEDLFTGNIKQNKAEENPSHAHSVDKDQLHAIIKRGEATTLARFWVKGTTIDWKLLYTRQKPQRISLPTYPFDRKRYWIPDIKKTDASQESSKLHPLLHRNESDLKEQKFTSVFSGNESFFQNHKVKGEKMLPGVAYLEWAIAAGRRSTGVAITRLKEVVWQHPIVISEKAAEIRISIYEKEKETGFDIYSEKEDEEILHSRGTLDTVSLPDAGLYDIEAIQKRQSSKVEKAVLYETFRKKGLDYGVGFQGITTLYYSEEEALSQLQLKKEAAYELPPGLLDSALQSCMGVGFSAEDRSLALPFSVREVTIYSALPETVWCYVRKSKTTKENEKVISYDIDLLNEKGVVLLSFKHFTALPLDGKANSKEAILQLYSPAWKEQEAVQENSKGDRLILLAGGSADLAEKLSEALEAETIAVTGDTATAYFINIFEKVKATLQKKAASQIIVVHKNSDYKDYGFVSGLLKTACLEHPKITTKVIGLESLSLKVTEELTQILQTEQNTSDSEVRYIEGKRQVKTLASLSDPDSYRDQQPKAKGQRLTIKEGGVYLITGGGGGLGRIFAGHISKTKGTKIILTGRSKLSKEKEKSLDHLPNTEYHSCDITDKTAVSALIQKVKDVHGKIDGIIHSAGVLRDRMLLKKTKEEVRAVLAPKIEGVKNLDEATKEETLDFMVLFSSMAAVTGNIGQGDYAAANAFMDGYAEHRNDLKLQGKRKGVTLSINWPLWSDGGMRVDTEKEHYLEKHWGIVPMPAAEGIKAFEQLLKNKQSQGIVIYGKEDRLNKLLINKTEQSAVVPASDIAVSEVEKLLIMLSSDLLKLSEEDIETDVDFSEYGVDSILMMKLLNTLEETFNITVEPTAILNYPTISRLAAYLIEEKTLTLKSAAGTTFTEDASKSGILRPVPPKKRRRPDPDSYRDYRDQKRPFTANSGKVAIIGMSCRLPGSDDVETFWKHLEKGTDLISETPAERWDKQLYYSSEPAVNKTYTTKGGFINNPGRFDAVYFKVNDSEALAMDPQQRIILELTRDLLAHAGYKSKELSGSNIGVYVGAKDNNYIRNNYHLLPAETYQHTMVNSISNMIAARVSDFYDLKGPSQAIDTACSSSLVAIHEAYKEIQSGAITMAIAGGIYIMTDAFTHIGFSQAEVLSKDGKSYVFDKRANGFVMGEGGGLVLLKDYEKAVTDGDHIYGIISGSAVNNDGKTMGLTVPNKEGQKQVIVQALEKARISPETITYYEAHGTGTLLGDPIEVRAATEVYRSKTGSQNSQYCAIGSVKSNLGHGMTAAGVTGLIKILLQIQHKKLVPTLNCETPHPRFKFEQSPFYPNTILKDWEDDHKVAAISSFGFGGTNAHMIIESEEDQTGVKRFPMPVERLSKNYYWLGQDIIKEETDLQIVKPLISREIIYDQPLMRDHKIFGRQVLMGVAHLSLSIETILKLYPEKAISMEKILFSNPLVLEQGEKAILEGTFNAESGQVKVRYNLDGIWTEASNSTLKEGAIEEEQFDIEVLKKNATAKIEGTQFYRHPSQECYGPSLETLRRLYLLGEDKALAELHTNDTYLENADDFTIHPALFDGAHVAGTLLLNRDINKAVDMHWPPLMIKKAEVITNTDGFNQKQYYAYIGLKKQNDQIAEFDIRLLNTRGKGLINLWGFTTKSIPDQQRLFKRETLRAAVAEPVADKQKLMIPHAQDRSSLESRVETYLKETVGALLNKSGSEVSSVQNFMEMGVDSTQMIDVSGRLEKDLGIELYPTLFFEHQNIKELTAYFVEEHTTELENTFGKPLKEQALAAVEKSENTRSTKHHAKVPFQKNTAMIEPLSFSSTSVFQKRSFSEREDMAIIGMSGYLPESKDLEEFWQHIEAGRDMITEIPEDHWDYKPWFSDDRDAENKTYSKWGGFLKDVDKFDPLFFGIPPRQADWMDPQLRLLLQSVYHTFEDAGEVNRVRGSRTGVYVGSCFHEYWDEVVRAGIPITDYQHTSSVMSSLSASVSYYFDLQGGSVPLDNACASSMTALHLGCQAIRSGEIDMAVIGGLNVLLSPLHYVYFSRIQALSPTGRCHTFDEKADGYVPGEGVVSVLIKPLSKAIADGNRIHGVIKGSAINHVGKSNNPTSPRPELQTRLLTEAWDAAGINPENITYLEAHGTGTQLGDPIEINALKRAFKKYTTKEGFCRIGSTKAHIGHLEGAAGLASVIKVLLMMKNRTIPRMPNYRALNPYIKIEGSPLIINTENETWASEKPLLAGISSFGMTGNNAHVVIEEYPEKLRVKSDELRVDNPAVVLLSAKNRDRLRDHAENLKVYLEENKELNLYDVAYTLQLGREAMEERLAFIADGIDQTIHQLSNYLEGNTETLFTGNIKKDKSDFILKGGSGQAYINYAIENKELEALAQLWVRGVTVDWEFLYGKTKPRKLGLPGYPFARRRYWIPESESGHLSLNGSVKLHPLLHSNSSTMDQQRFTSVFNGKESFLEDHKVMGEHMLPGVVYLELAREAGVVSLERPVTLIKDIIWLSPVRVNEKGKEVHIGIFETNNEIGFEVYSTEGEQEIIHSQGVLSTAKQSLPENYNLEAIRKRLAESREKEECYRLFKEKGIAYGSTFQGIETLYYSDKEALSRINLPKEDGYVLQPGILDSALQTCLGLSFSENQSLALPFSVKQVIIYSELLNELWCYARNSKSTKEDAKVKAYDIDLLNDKGEILLSFKEFTVLPLEGFKSSYDEKQLQLYTPVWKKQEAKEEEKTGSVPIVILAGGSPTLAEKLGDTLEAEVIAVSENSEKTWFIKIFETVKSKLNKKESTQLMVVCRNSDYKDYGFVSGLLKTVRLEKPKVGGKLIEVDSLSLKALDELTKIIETEQNTSVTEIRYVEGKRQVKILETISEGQKPEANGQRLTIKEGGIYLITGGAGGLGRIFAGHISKTKDTRIILTGRSKLSKEKEQSLYQLPNTEYHSCDITDKKQVDDLIGSIKEEHGRLDGIVHSAGVIRDRFLLKKTEEEIKQVLSPKIDGVKHLDDATKSEELDFMVLFSSVAGVTGNIGQGDYASANAFLDTFAAHRNQLKEKGKRKGHTLSINWPLWEEGGMQIDKESEKYLETQWGMLSLPTEKGLEAFESLLSGRLPQGIVVYGKAEKLDKVFLQQSIAVKPAAAPGKNAINTGAIEQLLIGISSQLLKIDEAELEIDVDFSEYGIDSILMMQLLNVLEEQFKITLEPAAIINYPTISDLAGYLAAEKSPELESPDQPVALKADIQKTDAFSFVKPKRRPRFQKSNGTGSSKVAIIGMSCRLPGSDNPESFWKNLERGTDLITDTPGDRWDASLYYDAEASPDKTYTTKGGFMNTPGLFDAPYFKINDYEAIAMDPQQRIVLEMTRELLAHAGYEKEELSRTKTGVYIGAKDNNYIRNNYHLLPSDAYQHTIVNSISNMISARVSDFYDLRGTSHVIDTACSSSLVAIHEACGHIQSGKSEMAIAGGIYLMVDAFSHIGFSQARVLSKDGKSFVFDERANGFVLGEGGGLVLLKDYEKAKADGDCIYGVISGSAVNNDGNTIGLTVPNKQGQKQVIEEALEKSGIDPEAISYYEAHGTGTLLGDPIEVKAATEVYQSKTGLEKTRYCAIGSVKSNLGHTMTAAGVTGLIKVLLQMQHGKIVPTLNCENPHPRFKFDQSPFYPNTTLKDWDADRKIAAISSFGFGGTNCHIIIESQDENEINVKRSPLPVERLSNNHYWLGKQVVKSGSRDILSLAHRTTPVPAKAGNNNFLLERTKQYLQEQLVTRINKPSSEIPVTSDFMELGLNSPDMLLFVKEFEKQFQVELHPTLLFEHTNIEELAGYLVEEYPKALEIKFNVKDQKSVDLIEESGIENKTENIKENNVTHTISPLSFASSVQMNSSSGFKQETVAIIGLSGRYPGARNINEFWENLKSSKDSITEIPEERWKLEHFYDAEKDKEGKSYSKWGGFIEDVDKFDPLFFNISPREAELMDPQERLFLQTVWECIEDAGYTRAMLRNTDGPKGSKARVGVYAGVMYQEYQLFGAEQTLKGNPVALASTPGSIANRVSYFLNLNGPSMAVDTMCSSSLTAIHLACKAIQNRETEMAIAGGVNVSVHPNKYLMLSRGNFVSDKGRCESFGEGGNGYVPGEGVGAVLLKPLSKAEADGDHIYGVIRGGALNHGGKTNGYTVPNPKAQAAVIREAMEKAGVKPQAISYVEAHGTGTSLGDPIEIAGLTKAYQTDQKQYCAIGSVKSNIGHGESAAGISGLTKILLQMKYKQLVPSLHSATLNPNIDFENSPFKVQQKLEKWKTENGRPRIAGLSSFGAGGSNVHLVIEEHNDQLRVMSDELRVEGPVIIVLSAKSKERLREVAKNLLDYLTGATIHNSEFLIHNLHDVAYTLQTGREAMEERLALLCNDTNDLMYQLNNYLDGKEDGIFSGNIKKEKSDFILSGPAGKDYLRSAIKHKQIDALAQLWVKGVEIDWNLLYNDQKPKRINLPTYPFAGKRYWIPEIEAASMLLNGNSKLHPLLHTNESDLNEQKFTGIYTGKESFLEDHKVNGEKILPGTAFLELAREAAYRSIHKTITQIRNVSWFSPVRVADIPQKISISLFEKNDGIAFEVYSEKEGEERIHSQGSLSTEPQPAPEAHDPESVRNRLAQSKIGEECYRIFKETGIDYGPTFQGIETIYYSDKEALSKINLPREKGYVLQPGILDSALQTCAALNFSKADRALALPFSIGEVTIYRELPGELWCYARKSEHHKPDAKVEIFDIDLLNDKGEILLSFKDFMALPFNGSKPSAEEKASLQLYSSAWQQQKAIAEKNDTDALIILAGGSAALAENLSETLETEVLSMSESTAEAWFISFFGKLKATLQEKAPVQIMVVFRNTDYKDYGFVSGLLKTARLENPKLNAKVIGVESLSLKALDELTGILQSEQNSPGTEVRYREGKRQVKTLIPLPEDQQLTANPDSPDSYRDRNRERSVKEGGVYLITGGVGGLGRIFAAHISKTKGVKVILTGRSKPDEERQEFIRMLNAEYHECDVTDRKSVRDLIRAVKEKHKQINGIIHSAGITRDSFLLKKTEEEAMAVLAPKIKGIKYLDDATKKEALDFVIYFSSVASVLGNPGQGDYASANAYMDSFAAYRNRLVKAGKRKGHTLSINWPLWQEGGMTMDEEQRAYLERSTGMLPLPTLRGIDSLEILLRRKISQGIVMYGKGSRINRFLIKQELLPEKHQPMPVQDNSEKLPAVSVNGQGDAHVQEAFVKVAATGITDEDMTAKIIAMLKQEVSGLLKIAIEDIDEEAELSEFGFDSVMLTKFSNTLSDAYGITLTPAIFFEYDTMTRLADYLINTYKEAMLRVVGIKGKNGQEDIGKKTTMITPQNAPAFKEHRRILRKHHTEKEQTSTIIPVRETPHTDQPIAIVGFDCVLPGAENPDAFWDNIYNKKSAIVNISKAQWRERGLVLSDDQYQTMKWVACLSSRTIKEFDAGFFGIENEAAKLMDPMQRLLLHSIWNCIEFSGYSPGDLSAQKVGLFVGAGPSEYRDLIAPALSKYDLHSISGLFGNMVANRLSYLLNLRGPSEVFDTACSSVYAALHRAVQSLKNSECDTAIVSGANIHLGSHVFQGFSEIGLLSKTGTCHSFDHRGNGYVRGEGLGTVCLKPLNMALKEGAHIYGVIHGTGISHNGAKSLSLISPDTKGQTAAMLMAYQHAKANPAHIQYIEAHGTGTPMADASEIAAFKAAFKEMGQFPGTCGLGSVKGNIGHLETASGIPSLIKVLQAYRHNILPPIYEFNALPAAIRLEKTPFYIVDQPVAWEKPDNPDSRRYASLHSFGFGGVNAHLVLSDYENTKPSPCQREELIVISAKTYPQLLAYVTAWEAFVKSDTEICLADLAFTSQVGRDSMAFRAAVVCHSRESLLERLSTLKEIMSREVLAPVIQEHLWFNPTVPSGRKRKKIPEETQPVMQDARMAALARLAASWVSGKEISWKGLYASEYRKRIVIPMYPFAKKQFWIEEITSGNGRNVKHKTNKKRSLDKKSYNN